MTLQENLPSNLRQPGSHATFDDTSGSRGLAPLNRRLMIIAMKTAAAPAAADTPIQVFSELEARTQFGQGSEAALMVEWAYRTLNKVIADRGGGAPEVYVCPVADPAGTAAIHRFAFGGTATEGGTIALFVAGRRVNVAVALNDAAATIATNAAAAINALQANLPVTAASATVNCDVTAVNTGANGSRILIGVDSQTIPAGVTVTPTQDQTAGVGVASLVNALAATLTPAIAGQSYMSIAIANHVAQDVTDLGTHMDTAWGSKKQAFRHAFIGVNQSLGTATTLASGGNRKELCVGSMENCGNTPGEIAAALAAMNLSQERPAYNFNRTELPLFVPLDPADHYLDSEVETALAGGVTPISVNEQNTALMERLFTTSTTVNSAAFENLRPLKNSKTGAIVAKSLDNQLKITQLAANLDSDFLRRIIRRAINVLRQFETLGDLHRVDEHLGEVRAAVSAAVADRALLEVPYSVIPDANQVDATYRLFVEAAEL